MRNVMMKAQELAEAILESETYRKMKQQENDVKRDPDAAKALGDMIEKRNRVETVLSSANMNPEELAEASREMEEAENRMNENEMIRTLKDYRKDFQTMMDNVNRILRLVITGETEDENGGGSGCSGNCSGCSGCR
ncbi:MAG: YlbF family regulator [Clostridiales bacterium]|nr:YlbF family regulator [Clostridia bacterium]MCR5567367.1 YlbF family regulator [Clostridiales bacterium]